MQGKECWLSIRKETSQDQTQFTMREHATCIPRSNYFANREMTSLTIEILHTSLNLQIQTKTWKYLFNVKEESFLVEHHNASFQYIKRDGESPRRVRLYRWRPLTQYLSSGIVPTVILRHYAEFLCIKRIINFKASSSKYSYYHTL